VRSIRLMLLLFVTHGVLGAQDVMIKNTRVFDGERVFQRASVLVRNGKIEQIGPHIPAPKNVRVVDGRGKTLIPALIDSHTHIHSRRDLEQSAVFGVLTDISMLMDLQLATAEKAEQNANGASDRADLFSSGYVATAPGGHGTEYGLKFATLTDPRARKPGWMTE
jgi:dihydroorotase-like cyclic amidohydrolase